MPAFRSLVAFSLAALLGVAALGSGVARAQQEGVEDELTPGISAYNAGRYEPAAINFFKVAEGTSDPVNRQKAEFYLGQCFLKMSLYQPALGQFLSILRAGAKHRYYYKAIDGLVSVSEALGDEEAIPSQLDKAYGTSFERLPEETLNKVNYLLGVLDYRRNKIVEAQDFLSSLPEKSSYYARARYLYGLTLQAKRPKDSIKIYKKIMALSADAKQFDLANVQQLSRLALARTYYGLGKYDQSAKYYEAVPRFSNYWDVALFENGWAEFQDLNPGKAMGALESLHAPQFEGAFAPESWILKSTIYFFSCLYPEAKGAVAGFRRIYLPMDAKIKEMLAADHDYDYYAKLVEVGNPELSPALVNYLISNKIVVYYRNFIQELAKEKTRIEADAAWRDAGLTAELAQDIDSQSQNEVKFEGRFIQKRLKDASKSIEGFDGNAEIILFETLKAEKELIERNVDVSARLQEQKLYRAKVPDPSWDYWRFEGEFWIDEIGYYEYTLKNACTLRQSKSARASQ